MHNIQILIVDLGFQYTLVIGRTLRELGFRSAILSSEKAKGWLKNNKPKAIIFSGGSASVYEENAPTPPKEILKLNVPILGICFGMHWLVQELGGVITPHQEHKEYGTAKIKLSISDNLFLQTKPNQVVWASHGDSVTQTSSNFKIIATSNNEQTIAAISNIKRKIWGVQFHPEVTQTEQGKDILQNFLTLSKCKKDWNPKNVIKEIRNEVKQAMNKKKAIIGFSGGVDSSTLSAVLSPILKNRLLAVCIETGALRKDEMQEVKLNAMAVGVQLKIVKASSDFQKAMGQTVHSEMKRMRFKKLYGKILEKVAKDFDADFIIQGTLATALIESGKVGEADMIKTHHNTGLNLNIKELHPFRNLFKYEIRELAKELKLPLSIVKRQPFPGPGLFLRVVGKPPIIKRLSIVKWADYEITKILKKHKLYNKLSQLVVALICVPTVGIKGDKRSYKDAIVIRAIQTSDFMTARGFQFPPNTRRELQSSITKHPEVTRVWFDENDKPPATTEFE